MFVYSWSTHTLVVLEVTRTRNARKPGPARGVVAEGIATSHVVVSQTDGCLDTFVLRRRCITNCNFVFPSNERKAIDRSPGSYPGGDRTLTAQ